MQIQQFESLELQAKTCLAWRKGIHLTYRSEGEFYMSLYRLDNFYVELMYHTSCDGVIAVNCFSCEEKLQSYLEQIDISNIFEI